MRTLLYAALVAMAGAPALAVDESGNYAVKGLGGAQCQSLVTAAEQQNAEALTQMGSWMIGYLSAINQYEQNTFDIIPWQSPQVLLSNMLNVCKANPETTIIQAFLEFAQLLGQFRLTEQSDLITVEHAGQKVVIYKEILRRAQQRLIDSGRLTGKADGVYGPATRGAFERYQTAENLPVTGLPDQPTLQFLLLRDVVREAQERAAQQQGAQ